jgi:MFS family permease
VALTVTCVWTTRGLEQEVESDGGIVVALVGYATVGALVASRRPSNAVGWLLMAIAFAFVLQIVGEAYIASRSNPAYLAVAVVTGSMFSVWLMLVVSFLPLLFPDGHALSRRWRALVWFNVLLTALLVLVGVLLPGELAVSADIDNPIHLHGPALTLVQAVGAAGGFLLVPTVLLTGLTLVLRFRRSHGRERQQVKWFAFAGLMTVAGLLIAALGNLLPSAWREPVGGVGWAMFLSFAILGIPIATGIAILRHRLYDIDVVINRTLVYGTLTAALAAIYVGSVLLLRLVLTPLAGESALSVAGSTLAVAALFRPARARIQAAVDRRFYRSRYDASRTLDDFAHRLRHELDLDAVGADLCAAADRTVQPSHISLWLRP